MAKHIVVHAQNPQPRLIRLAAIALSEGKVIVCPTDTCYALAALITDRPAQDKIREIRRLHPDHPLTLLCRDLAQVGQYCHLDERAFSLLRRFLPGSYAFILPSKKNIPRHALSERKTIGVRISGHPVVAALLDELGEPLVSSTLWMPEDDSPLTDPDDIFSRLKSLVGVVLDAGVLDNVPTTTVDLSGEVIRIVRVGKGDPAPFVSAKAT